MACETCGAPLVGKQKRFCSRQCLGAQYGGYNKLGLTRTCEECGKTFSVTPNRVARYNVRACSRVCLGKIQSRERVGWQTGALNHGWKGGIQTYRRHRKNACERCESTKHLLVHHKDGDRYNNELANLETLCKRCHQLHHECWRNLPSQ